MTDMIVADWVDAVALQHAEGIWVISVDKYGQLYLYLNFVWGEVFLLSNYGIKHSAGLPRLLAKSLFPNYETEPPRPADMPSDLVDCLKTIGTKGAEKQDENKLVSLLADLSKATARIRLMSTSRQYVRKRQYAGGPLSTRSIDLTTWSRKRNYIVITDENGIRHLYVRRSRIPSHPPLNPAAHHGECEIRYLGVWRDSEMWLPESELPFLRGLHEPLTDQDNFEKLFELVKHYVRTYPPSVPILLQVERVTPDFICSQIVHSKVDDSEIQNFLEFVRDLRWPA